MDRKLIIVLSAKDEATAVIRGVTRNIEGMKAPIRAVAGLAAALGAVSVGRKVFEELKEATKAASEQEQAEAALRVAIRGAGQELSTTAPLAIALASKYSLLSGVQDDVILSGEKMLITMGRLRGEGLERGLRAALDLGTYLKGDFDAAFKAVAKAAAGNFTALQKLGIVVDDSIPKSQRYEAVITLLSEKMGGQFAAKAATYQGQLDRITVSHNELQEAVGRFITQSETVKTITGAIVAGLGDMRESLNGISETKAEETIRGIAIVMLDFVNVGILAVRLAHLYAGALGALGKDIVKGGEDDRLFGNLRRFISEQPAADKALQQLQARLDGLSSTLEHAGAVSQFPLLLGHVPVAKEQLVGLKDALEDSLGTHRPEAVRDVSALQEALQSLRLPKLELQDPTSAIRTALAELGRERATVKTDAGLRQIDEMIARVEDLRSELRSPVELAVKAAGGDTLTKLKREAVEIGNLATEISKQETGPRTQEAEADVQRLRRLLEDLTAALLKKQPAIQIPGLDKATQATARVNIGLEISGGTRVGELQVQITALKQAIQSVAETPLELLVPGEREEQLRSLNLKLAELEQRKARLAQQQDFVGPLMTPEQLQSLKAFDEIRTRSIDLQRAEIEDAARAGQAIFDIQELYAERGAEVRIAAGNRAREAARAAIDEEERLRLQAVDIEIEALNRLVDQHEANEKEILADIALKEREKVAISRDAGIRRLELQREFVAQMITSEEALLEAIREGMDKLRHDLESGRKVVQDFGDELKTALKEELLRDVDRLAARLADVGNAGRQSWRDFAEQILRDLAAIMIRLLLIQAIKSAIGGFGSGGGSGDSGRGHIWSGSMAEDVATAMAKGGIVPDSPTRWVRAAAGFMVTGGTPGKDSVPILAMPGEAVLPKDLTDLLRAAAGAPQRPIQITMRSEFVGAERSNPAVDAGVATATRARSPFAGPDASSREDAQSLELDLLAETEERKAEIWQESEERRAQIEADAAEARNKAIAASDENLSRKRLTSKKSETQQILASLRQFQEVQTQFQKESFKASQKAAYKTAVINIAEGATKALAQGGIAGPTLAAIVTAFGVAQLGIISAQKFAKGGLVPGFGDRDTVPALLTPGEFVVTRQITTMLKEAAARPPAVPVVPGLELPRLASSIRSASPEPEFPSYLADKLIKAAEALAGLRIGVDIGVEVNMPAAVKELRRGVNSGAYDLPATRMRETKAVRRTAS